MLENPFLLACSGGIDSMVLWALCRDAALHFEVAHCNFGLRGAESEQDADFVREMGQKWNAKINSINFNTVSYSKKIN